MIEPWVLRSRFAVVRLESSARGRAVQGDTKPERSTALPSEVGLFWWALGFFTVLAQGRE